MSRDVEYDPYLACDGCGNFGIHDFYGDFICPICYIKIRNQDKIKGSNPKIIIIEGQRATGKTTISKYIAEHANYKYHKEPREKETIDQIFRTLEEWDGAGGRYVADRFHLTEFIFSVYHKRFSLDYLTSNVLQIQSFLVELNAKVIILDTIPTIRAPRMLSRERDKSHRQDDMPETIARSMWQFCSVFFDVPIIENNAPEDIHRIFRELTGE